MSRRGPLPAITVLALAASFAACAESSGEIRGGERAVETPPADFVSPEGGPPDLVWEELYRELFGPSSQANCSRSYCHGAPGTVASTSGIQCFDARSCRASILERGWVLLPGDVAAPESSGLYTVLRFRLPDGGVRGTMPKEPADKFFTQAELDDVAAWIRTLKAE